MNEYFSTKIFRRAAIWALSAMVIITFLLYAFINWQKHIHFQTFAWDTSVFDQQVFLFSIFDSPYSSMMKMNGLGDHFHPLVLVVGGILYRVWADPRVLFSLQSMIVSLSTVPLYLTTQHLFKKLNFPKSRVRFIGLSISGMYLYSVSTQAMVLDEFHDDVLVSLPILWMLYALITKRERVYWLMFVLVLLTKEEYGILGVPLGLYIWISTKNITKALVTAIFGLATFYLLLYQVMPALSQKPTYDHFRPENKPTNIMANIVSSPPQAIIKFVDHPQKQKTIFTSLVSFGCLPLFSPPELIMPLSSLALRFYDESTPRRYEFNNHYASPFIPVLAFASVFGIYNLARYFIKNLKISPRIVSLILPGFILFITVYQNIHFHGPINSIFKKSFYQTQSWQYDAYELINQVPKNINISIAAQNSLLPHLSQRKNFYLLPEFGDATYIAVDLHDGPNKFSPLSHTTIHKLIDDLTQEKKYQIIWQKNEAMILKKI